MDFTTSAETAIQYIFSDDNISEHKMVWLPENVGISVQKMLEGTGLHLDKACDMEQISAAEFFQNFVFGDSEMENPDLWPQDRTEHVLAVLDYMKQQRLQEHNAPC